MRSWLALHERKLWTRWSLILVFQPNWLKADEAMVEIERELKLGNGQGVIQLLVSIRPWRHEWEDWAAFVLDQLHPLGMLAHHSHSKTAFASVFLLAGRRGQIDQHSVSGVMLT